MSLKKAVLAGGCFWGMEDLFRSHTGVVDTQVGYTGGTNSDPTYEYHPGHAEALEIVYDDTQTSYQELLDFFFRIHDPTTLNRQGNDVGSSYRSAIFYGNQQERQLAEKMIEQVNRPGLYHAPLVTSLEKLTQFYPAEEYHQDYLIKNPGGYSCHYVRKGMGRVRKLTS